MVTQVRNAMVTQRSLGMGGCLQSWSGWAEPGWVVPPLRPGGFRNWWWLIFAPLRCSGDGGVDGYVQWWFNDVPWWLALVDSLNNCKGPTPPNCLCRSQLSMTSCVTLVEFLTPMGCLFPGSALERVPRVVMVVGGWLCSLIIHCSMVVYKQYRQCLSMSGYSVHLFQINQTSHWHTDVEAYSVHIHLSICPYLTSHCTDIYRHAYMHMYLPTYTQTYTDKHVH